MRFQQVISRTRRNHGLEHATLNLLAKKHPTRIFAGHSDAGGFWILGDIPTSELTEVSLEALELLRQGHSHLAIHQNCGTNLLTSGLFAGLAGAAGMIGAGEKVRDKLERFPLVVLLAIIALLIAQPLGPHFQKHLTTKGSPGTLSIKTVLAHSLPNTTAHRIQTQE